MPTFWKNLLMFAGVLLFLYVVDWGFLKGEITEYSIYCDPKVDCINLNPTTYKVSETRQEVIHWTDDSPPETLKNCSVVNRTNWSCKYNDGSAEFGFTKGNYFQYILRDSASSFMDDNTHYVSRLRYLMYYWNPKNL